MHRNTPAPKAPQCPIVQYSSGHVSARVPDRGAGRFAPLVGFYSEIGKDREFDQAAEAAGVGVIEANHGGKSIVRHWSLGERLAVWPLTAGPPAASVGDCLAPAHRAATAEAGIGLIWPDGERSRLAIRGYVLLGETPALIQLSVRSKMTDYLLAALVDHIRMCELADQLIAAAGKSKRVVFPVELALPLAAGADVTVGRDATARIAPLVSEHPAELTREYLAHVWRSAALMALAERDYPATQAWAAKYCRGDTNGDSHLAD